MPVNDRDRERYPWIETLIRSHGGNYKQIEGISALEISQIISRLRVASLSLQSAADAMAALGEDCVMSVGVSRLQESLAGIERGAEIQNLCLRHYQAYREQVDSGKQVPRKPPRKKREHNGNNP